MSENTSSNNKKGGRRKRAALVAALLLLLLLLMLLGLWGLGKLSGKGGGVDGKGGGAGGKGGSLGGVAADSPGTLDSLRALNPSLPGDSSQRALDSLRRALDSAQTANSQRLLDARRRGAADSLRRADSLLLSDSLRRLDALRRADSLRLADLLRELDSLRRWAGDSLWRADSLRLADLLRAMDSLRRAGNPRAADSLWRADSSRFAESLRAAAALAAAEAAAANAASEAAMTCAKDTVAPWVYPDPSGGLHKKAVSVKLVANKACSVEWSFDKANGWKAYDGKPISISKPATIYYKAVDACGRRMDVKSKRYEFDLSAPRCPAGMELAKAPGGEVCVDIYEWPNKKGAAPQAYVSLYQAMDSCFSARKRLCASEEWTAACGGPSNWAYAYGDAYEWNACATRDTVAQRAGSHPECRGYYGHFDMSGNLAEWTSTPSPQDKSFNNVMGGFWASGGQSRCADARYSYFPQNRHNPVGFRCCVDAPAAGGGR